METSMRRREARRAAGGHVAPAPRRARRGLLAATRRRPVPPLTTGRDVSAAPPRRRAFRLRPTSAAMLATGAVCAALLLVALRMESIRLRYELADAVRAEQQALEQQRRLTVEMRRLRHPLRLEEIGRELGLAPPARMHALASPTAAPRPEPAR